MSAIPAKLRTSIGALLVLTGLGSGTYYVDQAATAEAQQNQYIQAVAADPDMPDGMRIAMVLAAFYESSNRHIGTPYVDKVGKGQPLTVCNGLTGKDVVAGKWCSPADCFRLEKKRYVQYEQIAKRSLTYWEATTLSSRPRSTTSCTTRATGISRPAPCGAMLMQATGPRPAVKTCAGTKARSMVCPWCCPG